MARDEYRGVNESLYACSLEELGRRNRLIMIMFAGGLAWAWMFIEPLNIQWFFEESWLTYNALGDEAIEGEGARMHLVHIAVEPHEARAARPCARLRP